MRHGYGILGWVILGLVVTGPLNHAMSEERDVLATVGSQVITRADYEARVKAMPPALQRGLKESVEKRKETLDKMIKARLFVEEGEKRGLTEREEIKVKMRMIRDDLVTQEYVRAYIENKAEVTEEEAEQYYNKDPEIKEREYVKASQIVLDKESDAREALEKLKKGEPFKKIVMERSVDQAGKSRFGELDWIEKGKGGMEMEGALARVEKGGLSDIVRIEEKYYIFKVDDRRVVPKPPFLDVKDNIIRKLKSQKVKEWAEKEIENLKKETRVEAYYDKLKDEKN